jgi:MFS family permease
MSRASDAVRRTFHSVSASRNFRLFFIGQLISTTGTWVNATAASVLVLRLSDSGVALGINMALLFGPLIPLGAWGGALADRVDRRRILLVTQIAFAAISVGMWVLVGSGAIRLWMVYALTTVDGVVTAIDNPTRQSFYAELVGTEHITNAVSLNSAVFMFTRMLGAAVAGVLINLSGIAACYLLDAVSYVAVVVALWEMRPAEMHGFTAEPSPRRAGTPMDGLRYVWEDEALRVPLVLMTVVFTLSFNFSVLVPLLAEHTFNGGSSTLAWLFVWSGFGSFLGAIVMANRSSVPSMWRLGLFGLASGTSMLLTAAAPTRLAAFAAMVPLGLTAMLFIITANSLMQTAARPDMRGRVMALYAIVFLGSTPIGSPIAGVIGQHLGSRADGPRLAFAMGGVVALAAGLAAVRRARVSVPS